MIGSERLGTYLDRTIRLWQFAGFDQTMLERMDDSVLLLIFTTAPACDQTAAAFLSSVIEASPLAVAFYGVAAEHAFDQVLRELNRKNPRRHIMTMHIHDVPIEEAIEDYFFSTWPAEELFAEWKTCSIVIVGNSIASEVRKAVKRLSDP